MKIQLSKSTPMTTELLNKILDLHKTDEARKSHLAGYYVGEQDIRYRTMSDSSKPNNKLAHPYGNYITDTVVGYFMGEPVRYAAKDPEAEGFLEAVKEVFNFNDEQSQNIELAKDASKYGVAYELIYLDEAANIRFGRLDPIQCIPVYSNSLDNELLYFIRYYNDSLFDTESYTVEVYDEAQVMYYKKVNQSLSFSNSVPHAFKMVPIAVYNNNEEEKGDYELVISLIDAYDKLTSDSVNDFEAFADAYLTLKGMDGTTAEDLSTMKENRVLLLPQEGAAEWLTKNINDAYFQNTITNLDNDIHKFAKVPNMSADEFGNNLSGIAIKYKIMGLENKVAIKESHFKKGLQRRIELISNILYIMGSAYDYLGVDIIFARNLPVNEAELVAMANQLVGIVSDETLLSILPFVSDAAAELEKRDSQLDFIPEPIINEENGVV